MLETYKQFRRTASLEFVEKTNEELAQIYKNAKTEYERSQSVSALFVKNFPALLRVTSKYNHLESSDKAGMVAMELVDTLNDYNPETSKFITYLVERAENLLLWNYTNNEKRIKFNNSVDSLNRVVNDESFGDSACELGDFVADSRSSGLRISAEIKLDIKRAFKEEYRIATTDKQKQKLKFDYAVLKLIYEDPMYTSDQIARKLGWYSKGVEYEHKPKAPDTFIVKKKDVLGNIVLDKFGKPVLEVITEAVVRKSNYNRVFESRRRIQEMFRKYGILPEKYALENI